MVNPNDRQLQPPIRRSWLRLRLGKAYYAERRYLLWSSPKFHWARERCPQNRLPAVQFSHRAPLIRHLQGEDMDLQRNKIVNLRLAAARLDGILLLPGETFSYWKLIGKPTRRKGYLDGMGIVPWLDRQRCGRRAMPALQSNFLDDAPYTADSQRAGSPDVRSDGGLPGGGISVCQ